MVYETAVNPPISLGGRESSERVQAANKHALQKSDKGMQGTVNSFQDS